MDLLLISVAAFAASLLTLFSGFGLGTLLMPVIALFFPLELAVAMTALVHFANNLFKIGLVGRHARLDLIWRFGFPAMLAAFLGASLLMGLGEMAPLTRWSWRQEEILIDPVKLVIGALIVLFVVVELHPGLSAKQVPTRWLPLGGLLSGFFGGLSGHQGAFRSLFLLQAGMDKASFIGTGVVLAALVDVTRLAVYGWGAASAQVDWGLVIVAALAAFAGAYLGARLIPKVTLPGIRWLVSVMLAAIGLGLMAGLL